MFVNVTEKMPRSEMSLLLTDRWSKLANLDTDRVPHHLIKEDISKLPIELTESQKLLLYSVIVERKGSMIDYKELIHTFVSELYARKGSLTYTLPQAANIIHGMLPGEVVKKLAGILASQLMAEETEKRLAEEELKAKEAAEAEALAEKKGKKSRKYQRKMKKKQEEEEDEKEKIVAIIHTESSVLASRSPLYLSRARSYAGLKHPSLGITDAEAQCILGSIHSEGEVLDIRVILKNISRILGLAFSLQLGMPRPLTQENIVMRLNSIFEAYDLQKTGSLLLRDTFNALMSDDLGMTHDQALACVGTSPLTEEGNVLYRQFIPAVASFIIRLRVPERALALAGCTECDYLDIGTADGIDGGIESMAEGESVLAVGETREGVEGLVKAAVEAQREEEEDDEEEEEEEEV
eukprot:gnl/Carplike_NY0171/4325_a5867_351.p1 GENE.gnl/Carplike_NY0171/4325_a5867_351~~gnl/Carplike_NY0171/4325_a5867_351.p1  ORF type:complete len:449 (+),score=133.88 gnl/Carplike_NY0171/4325_a5867_351:124-1347(+)